MKFDKKTLGRYSIYGWNVETQKWEGVYIVFPDGTWEEACEACAKVRRGQHGLTKFRPHFEGEIDLSDISLREP